MPISGKHRRTKSSLIARGVAAVSTGGAIIALPLLGATGAHAAQPAAPAATSTASSYVHPVPGNHTTGYRASGSNWSSGSHSGIDFPVFTGTSVKSITAGTVVTAGWGGAYGNQVVVKHADGRYSQYGHLSSISVSVGQSVSTGQQIGLSGSTGNSTGPHLHFEVRTGPAYGSDINPVAYLAAHGIYV
ncbi:M23 family metallopeptidase [Streptomyces sp. NPDC002476]|uniref:M23 family metallopeptidase n=1 Tax=Streptomyces sp. NPDC002476 TaxID=3364648 RepID=UPI0036969A98